MPLPRRCELFYGLNLTEEQRIYVDSIFDNQLTFCNARAGTGKTTLAVGAARILKDLNPEQNLYYIFSPVEEGKMGFRPGKQQKKEMEYIQPLKDALLAIGENPITAIRPPEDEEGQLAKIEDELIEEFEQQSKSKGKKKQKFRSSRQVQDKYWVEAKSHIFMRGTNLPNSTLIIDEAQNFTHRELKKVLTRVLQTTKVIVIGHSGQIDLRNPKESGFMDYLEWFKDEPYCQVVELTKNFRGPLAQHADELVW